eukprot:TRINITY_DN5657_c0_g1_i1.p1 TRINITY_DN5657_c0_g1~~TRINITY_DN5657_c0_g1_i1.p1  ORF type:complete len:389 (+),score=38.98 TRINITY_DN5657_c0_g1_i1:161-1327(+)
MGRKFASCTVVLFTLLAFSGNVDAGDCTGKPAGLSRDPASCQCYFNCDGNGNGAKQCCAATLCFNPNGYCDYCSNVVCSSGGTSSPPPPSVTPKASPPPPSVAPKASPPPPVTSTGCVPAGPRGAGCAGKSITSIISQTLWNQFFIYGPTNAACTNKGFLSYSAFVTAAASFPCFGNEGNDFVRRREIAAFLGQVSHETTGGWATAPDGPYAWGLCFISEQGCSNTSPGCDYCSPSATYPCAPGKKYFGRGPIQLSYNYNYGLMGQNLGLGTSLLLNPDLLLQDAVLAWKTSLSFWMTPQSPKPSSHDVMVNNWVPSATDIALGRAPNGIGCYGTVTDIVNGGVECGGATPTAAQLDRAGFYNRYLSLLGISSPDSCDKKTCNGMAPF